MRQPLPGELTETIEVVPKRNLALARWQPNVGDETLDLLDRLSKLDDADKETVRREAISVLSRCLPPSPDQIQDTGLVIGFVQSGKTVSFTTLASLAHDNGYRLVIIITGLTTKLFEQSVKRLKHDLALPNRKWRFLENPQPTPETRDKISRDMSPTESAEAPRKTVLIAVMKNTRHLRSLIELLSAFDLARCPALVIDDEADQASLNNRVNQDDESATYRRLMGLRDCLPHHTYIQYTATPQALLLIDAIDTLSPSFVELLSPGKAYTGGHQFFEENALYCRIPPDEVPTRTHHLDEPPQSLLQAMRVFFIGVAAAMCQDGSASPPDNRSMMVHPAKEILQHGNYVLWVKGARKRWLQELGLSASDPDRDDLLEDFRAAYGMLVPTTDDLPPFDELLTWLPCALRDTIITEVNTSGGKTPAITWEEDYAHILVGGDVLSRGYTVEGLTVSYMPRSRGVGNADTIQQRARWFGYKADYLGYCRVYLTDRMRDDYVSFLEHERDVRERLSEFRLTGRPLSEWRRAFFLDASLQPTRRSVISNGYVRGTNAEKWFAPRAPHFRREDVLTNRRALGAFLSRYRFRLDEDHRGKTPDQRSLVSKDVPLMDAYERLLTELRYTKPGDSQRLTGLLLQIGSYLEGHPDAVCTVYQMRQGDIRRRRVDHNDEVEQLFQGPQPEATGADYEGDRSIKGEGATIQIHRLNVLDESGSRVIAADIPAVAVWLPRAFGKDWYVQVPK